MTDSEKLQICVIALNKIGKLMRDNPPGNLDAYPPKLINCLVGGLKRDPEGKEFVKYFLDQALIEYFADKNHLS